MSDHHMFRLHGNHTGFHGGAKAFSLLKARSTTGVPMPSLQVKLLKILLAGLLVGTAAHAMAQYPTKPIRLIVPFGAGSGSDMIARTVAEPLSQALGQPIVIDNKPGASSALGTDLATKAPADGYTLLFGAGSGVSAAPAGLVSNVSYDATKELSYISLVGTVSFVWLTNNTIEVRTPAELVEYIKASGGKLSYATGNAGGIAYMAYLKDRFKLDITHVPYKSAPQAVVDLLGNRIDLMILDVPVATPLIEAGKLRPLAVTSRDRSPLRPNLPTFAESGVFGMPNMDGWWVLCAPVGVSTAILDRLNAEMTAILKRPSVREKIIRVSGMEPTPSSRSEAEQLQREQLQMWKKLVKDFNLQPQ